MFSYTRADQDGDGFIEIKKEFTGDNTNDFVHTSVDNVIISGFFNTNKERALSAVTLSNKTLSLLCSAVSLPA